MRLQHVIRSVSVALAAVIVASQPVALALNPVAMAAAADQDTRPSPAPKGAAPGASSAAGGAPSNSNQHGNPDRLPVAPSSQSASSASATSSVVDVNSLQKHAAPTGRAAAVIPNQLIVTYKDSNAFQRASLPAAVGAKILKEHHTGNARLVEVSDVASAKKALSADANVASVEENQVAYPQGYVTNDPYLPYQWHLFPYSSNRGVDIASYGSASSAWNLTLGATSPMRIAFLDTGLDWNHPDLTPKGPLGYNFAESNGNWLDCNGHGTATAGTAAAAGNNSLGVAGADIRVPIYEAKIVTGCGGTSDYFTMGWALDTASQWSGTKTINISFGGTGYSSYLCQAATNAQNRNVLVVASAGNSNSNAATYPAACPGVVGVGATDSSGARASFSNWGSPDVYVSAPGVNILTTNLGGGYAYWSGTSFSSPLVAGIASLTWARYGSSFSMSTIRYWLARYAYNPDCGAWDCYSNNHGYGIPDAYWVAL